MPKQKKKPFNREARIARVLGSQGKSAFIAEGLEESALTRLAACCDEFGTVNQGAIAVVDEVLAEYYDAKKATVDDDASEPDDQ